MVCGTGGVFPNVRIDWDMQGETERRVLGERCGKDQAVGVEDEVLWDIINIRLASNRRPGAYWD